jgi:hypothetical protein
LGRGNHGCNRPKLGRAGPPLQRDPRTLSVPSFASRANQHFLVSTSIVAPPEADRRRPRRRWPLDPADIGQIAESNRYSSLGSAPTAVFQDCRNATAFSATRRVCLSRAVASVHRSETWWRRCALARGAIYQYFDSKEATLSPCWTRSFAVAGEIDWNFLIARLSSFGWHRSHHDKEERAERRDVYFLGLAVALFSLAIMVSAHL